MKVLKQLEPMTPARQWLEAHGLIAPTVAGAAASTTAMYIPPIVASVVTDLASTVVLYPLEVSLLEIHLNAAAAAAAGTGEGLVDMSLGASATACIALYQTSPALTKSLACEAVSRLALVCTTSALLQWGAATFIAMHDT
jgi:hypothetical protein